MSRSLSSMTRLSHTQRRDNSLRGSLQGLALSVGGVGAGTHDEHDEIDERPGAGDEDTDDGNRQHQLDDALRGVAQVEVVNTEGAQEEGQEHGDDPLLGSASSEGLTVGGLPVSGLAVTGLAVSLLAGRIGGLLGRVGAGDAVALLGVVRGAVGRRTGGRRRLVVAGGRGLGEGGSLSGLLGLEGGGLRIGRRHGKAFR